MIGLYERVKYVHTIQLQKPIDYPGAYWYGLENLHKLTTSTNKGHWEILINVHFAYEHNDYETYGYVVYDGFQVESEVFEYTLRVGKVTDVQGLNFTVDGGDEFSYSLLERYADKQFSTHDRDNGESGKLCGEIQEGGWWFNDYCIELNDRIENVKYDNTTHRPWFCPNCRDIYGVYEHRPVTEVSMAVRFNDTDLEYPWLSYNQK